MTARSLLDMMYMFKLHRNYFYRRKFRKYWTWGRKSIHYQTERGAKIYFFVLYIRTNRGRVPGAPPLNPRLFYEIRYFKTTFLPHLTYGKGTHWGKIYSIQLYWFDCKFVNFATIAENSASMRPHHLKDVG